MEMSGTTGDLAAFFAADKTFDEILEEACPNSFITSALGPVQTHSRRLWSASSSPDRMDQSISLHVEVVRAIQQGRSQDANRTMGALIKYLSSHN